jgi:dipeptidyl-peptidase 4
MKNLIYLFVGLLVSIGAEAQNDIVSKKDITLKDALGYTFYPKSIDDIQSLKDGDYYVVLNRNSKGSRIDKYSYKTFKFVETVVDGSKISVNSFTSYLFSPDESKVILTTDQKAIYRHSYTAQHYIYDLKTGEIIKLSDSYEQEPTFSKDGSKIAYVRDNNIYYKDLKSGQTHQVTHDGEFNKIINGVADWVYEEEFGFVRAFDWSADGKYLAYIKFDESEVPEISIDIFGKELYPNQMVFKYPKAGEKNSDVSLHIFELSSNDTKNVEVNEQGDFYIPRIMWNNEKHTLVYTWFNRLQNHMQINSVDAVSLKSNNLYTEKDEKYVDLSDDIQFLKDNSFVLTSEKDGYRHIYHYSSTGKLINQVTKGNWEVTKLYGIDQGAKRIYYQSTENGSINRGIYSVKLNSKSKRKLKTDESTNNASFSSNFNYFINISSTANTPAKYELYSSRGKKLKVIEDNSDLSSRMQNFKVSKKEFFTIKLENNVELNAWMMKPLDFDESKKYPVFMYVYGGPGSQTVQNSWGYSNYFWFSMLAQKGYIVVSVDNRGTGGKGADFKKCTYKELGKYEIEDQIKAAKYLSSLDYVDQDRIGMFGWSFGGYMTSLAMTKGADVFKAGIAVAPVTNWRFYDSVYTERYMSVPSENASGYDDNSPINHVGLMKGKYLLVHGSADDNVHYQNTMRMVESLVQANKQFDLFIYPDKNHGIYGGNTRMHLYTKMTNFILENL